MDDLAGFRRTLLGWFRRHGRDYPWRRTRDPYAVLVSEMMLQQTQVATVLEKGYFTRWMARFPDATTLASAEESEVLRHWEGLGYYRRARNLLALAREVVSTHDGQVPVDPATLAGLPGIGPYSAAAVAAFAANLPVAVVDANIARVTARLTCYREPVDTQAGKRLLTEAVAAWVPPRASRAFNSALMELGQRICLPRHPACADCPVSPWCAARDHHPERLPATAPRRKTVDVVEHAIFLRRSGRLLLQIEEGARRTGLWKLPARTAREVEACPLLDASRYTITHHRVDLRVHAAPARSRARRGESWIREKDLPDLPMPSPYRRVLGRLLGTRGSG